LLCCVQVPLMAALPTAQAAMDAHRGVAAVAENGLALLANLAAAEATRVSGSCCRLFGCALLHLFADSFTCVSLVLSMLVVVCFVVRRCR
jgi:hypothetical protein